MTRGTEAVEHESITAYVYTFNEEDNIAECVRSVLWCDEVLVVDAFSTDRTVEIARGLGARVIQHRWEGYREQSRFALGQVRTAWALSLDADERISERLRASIESVLRAPRPDVSGYRLPRVTYHLGAYFRHGTLFKNACRLARTGRCRWVGDNPHCHLAVDGRVETLEGDFLHLRDRDLHAQARIYNQYSTQKAEEMWLRGRRAGPASVLLRPLGRFLRSYLIKQGFRHGAAGFVAAVEEASYVFYKYAKLWERGRASKSPGPV